MRFLIEAAALVAAGLLVPVVVTALQQWNSALSDNILPIFLIVTIFAIFVFSARAVIRRLHDLNRSLLWTLLLYIPIINIIFVIGLAVIRGDIGENDYGPAA